jgi:hypothetical protein
MDMIQNEIRLTTSVITPQLLNVIETLKGTARERSGLHITPSFRRPLVYATDSVAK